MMRSGDCIITPCQSAVADRYVATRHRTGVQLPTTPLTKIYDTSIKTISTRTYLPTSSKAVRRGLQERSSLHIRRHYLFCSTNTTRPNGTRANARETAKRIPGRKGYVVGTLPRGPKVPHRAGTGSVPRAVALGSKQHKGSQRTVPTLNSLRSVAIRRDVR